MRLQNLINSSLFRYYHFFFGHFRKCNEFWNASWAVFFFSFCWMSRPNGLTFPWTLLFENLKKENFMRVFLIRTASSTSSIHAALLKKKLAIFLASHMLTSQTRRFSFFATAPFIWIFLNTFLKFFLFFFANALLFFLNTNIHAFIRVWVYLCERYIRSVNEWNEIYEDY